MIKKKSILFTSLSLIIISFLINSAFLCIHETNALVEQNNNHITADSIDRSNWIWNITEVVSSESSWQSLHPSLSVDSQNNVYVAWSELTAYWYINYKGRDFSSSTWNTTNVVSTGSEGAILSILDSLVVDSSGDIHISWTHDYDMGIRYKRWNSTTSSWGSDEYISTVSNTIYSSSLDIDSSGNVHIAWTDDTNYAGAGTDDDIFYKRWNASSSSWTTTEVVSTESTSNSYNPSLAVDSSGNVHIAWHDYTNYAGASTDRDIFYKCWDSSSSSWTATEVVSIESTSSSQLPSLDVDSFGNVHIAWYDNTDYDGAGTDSDIFYKRRISSSSSWTTTEVISTESTSNSVNPSLAVDSSSNVHISWCDFTDYSEAGTDADIFYKYWDISFLSWGITEVISTESTADSTDPSLAVDSFGNVHIVWEDLTDYAGAGLFEDIFYKFFSGPSSPPELGFLVPNPTEYNTVDLNWNDVGVSIYHIYRSTSYIWSIKGMNPIASVTSNYYIDSGLSEGFFYYVVVAENFAGNSTISNCQYIEVKFSDLDSPELATILPNPTDLTSVSLVWDDIDGATDYYIYRSDTYIWSVDSLIPIATENTNSYIDTVPAEGNYFYVIVATDGVRNSTHSNCEYVVYELPHVQEFVIISSLILGTLVILFVYARIRKKKLY